MSQGKEHFNRREFLLKTFSGIASVGFLGLSEKGQVLHGQEKLTHETKKKIIFRTLGRTGIQLPIVNMGVMNADNPALLQSSYKVGVRYFDTAGYYQRGRNEEMVGNVIKELKIRDKVIIGTKVYIPHQQRGMSPEQMKKTFLNMAEESLKRLQMDYVDILYLHVVEDVNYLNNPGIKEALELLKKEKKTRFIGFSTHANMTECINEAARTGFYDVILTAFNYSMYDNKELIEAIKNAASKGIGIIAMKTQCQQPWYLQQYEPSNRRKYYEGKIIHTAVLKWVLRHEYITTAIPGYTTFQQMEEDFSVAYNLEYTPEEKKFLEDRNVKLAIKGYCQQCYQCIPSCPHRVDIPTLIRVHMYAVCYGNFYQARDTLNSISHEKNLQMCASCNTCKAICVNRVDIPKRISELKAIYV